MDWELLRNGSGYVDYTAYSAMTNCMKGNKNMRTGEIWETEKAGGVGYAVVIADHGNFTTSMYLFDQTINDKAIEIKADQIMHGDPRKLSYVHSDKLTRFVRKLTDDEFQKILVKVGEALGLSYKERKEPEIMEKPDNSLEIQLLTAEKEVYKELYEKLLDSVLNNAGR